MPIDNATLDQYISEVAGDDQDFAKLMREKFGTNQTAATKFVNGFLGRADVTRRQQEVAREREQLQAAQQSYEQRLTEAETEKNRIMRDLADARISGSRAQALLSTVQQAYGLTENDLPGLEDIKATERTGRVVDSTPDLDQRIAGVKDSIMKEITEKLIPEISSLAIIAPIWNEIGYEHQELFGKRLGKKEQAEILAEARKSNLSLEQVWAEKYNVGDRRLEVRDEQNKSKWKREWEDEQSKRFQDEALSGVRRSNQDQVLPDRQSPLFKKNFMPQTETPAGERRSEPAPVPAAVRTDAQAERLSGAERAAAKWMERSRSGQLGKPIEQKAS